MNATAPIMSQQPKRAKSSEPQTAPYSISGDGVLQVSSIDLLRSAEVQRQIEALKEQLQELEKHNK